VQIEYAVCGTSADVLIGPWPEPDDDGAMPADERRRVAVRVLADRGGDPGESQLAIELDGVRQVVDVMTDGDVLRTRSVAGALAWELQPRFADHDAHETSGGPVCPLPGTVIAVNVAAGDEVDAGAVLMVVEAMKMEHKIVAPAPSVVSDVHFDVGARVDQGDLLVSLDASPSVSDTERDGGGDDE
jgi:propionyl-CoA carboxylase alpha chain